MNGKKNVMESSLHLIAEMTREELISGLLNFPGTFKFDFTREYLATIDTDQLRHMLMAAYLHAYNKRKTA